MPVTVRVDVHHHFHSCCDPPSDDKIDHILEILNRLDRLFGPELVITPGTPQDKEP